MTDKQENNLSCQFLGENHHEKESDDDFEAKIIINGVDVSGCPCLQAESSIFRPICSLKNGKPDTPNINCKFYPNCSFKVAVARKDERIKELEKVALQAQEMAKEIEKYNKIHERKLSQIAWLAEKASVPPCANAYCDCLNCNDEITNNGVNCMEKALKQIKQIAQGE